MVYINGIRLFSKDPGEHFKHLQIVFDRLRKHGLKLKLPKCQFLKDETNYLGFIINKNTVKSDRQGITRGQPVVNPLVTDTKYNTTRRFVLCQFRAWSMNVGHPSLSTCCAF